MAAALLATSPIAASGASAAPTVDTPTLSTAVAIQNIDYSEGQTPDEVGDPNAAGRWELNLVIPAGCAQPVPIFIDNPGSAWMSTDTNTTTHPITGYCYAFAGVNDSASSLCKFPCTTHDLQAAIRWLRAHAKGWTNPADGKTYSWDLDANRIAISGFSSGGWQSAFAGTTNGAAFSRTLPDGSTYKVDLEGTIGPWEGIYSSDVQAVVPLHPPVDFSHMNAPYTGVGLPSALDHDAAGSPESNHVGCTVGNSRNDDNPLYTYDPACEAKVQSANPIQYVTPDDPPFMMFHGSSDSLVPHGQSVELYNALKANCSDVQFYSMDGHNHAPVYMDLPVSSPYVRFASKNCGTEHIAPGPPEQTLLVPEGTLETRYPATWAGVAAFLDDHLRETKAPELTVATNDRPRNAQELRDKGKLAVQVTTDEAASFTMEVLANGKTVGTKTVPIYAWGSQSPKGTPAPLTSAYDVPVQDNAGLAGAREIIVRVTARDRVGNVTVQQTSFGIAPGNSGLALS